LECFAVPRSLEDRRRAVAAALRAVAAEPMPAPPVAVVVAPVVARLDDLAGRLDEVLERLDSVETVLLEAAWDDEPKPEPADGVDGDATVAVPPVDLGEGRMSSVAAKALFGH
jgi:hypothetical protein